MVVSLSTTPAVWRGWLYHKHRVCRQYDIIVLHDNAYLSWCLTAACAAFGLSRRQGGGGGFNSLSKT